MNSRAKGQRGELEFCKLLEAAGFPACRNDQQGCGGFDNPDLYCDGLDRFHLEISRAERINLHAKLRQAIRDAAARVPVVAHRPNRGEWVVVLRAEDFLELVRGKP